MSGGERVTRWGRVGRLPQGNGRGLVKGRLTMPTPVLFKASGHTGGLAERVWPLEMPPHQPWCLMGRGTSHLLRNVPSAVLP